MLVVVSGAGRSRALTGRRVGGTAVLRTPGGQDELTVIAIEYEWS